MGFFKAMGSLPSGMWVTLKHLGRTTLGRKKVTEQYPHEKPELPKAYRSAIKLIRFPETDSHDCVGCKACERICPSACISVDGDRVEGIKKKRATHFEMDFALCSLCGLCLGRGLGCRGRGGGGGYANVGFGSRAISVHSASSPSPFAAEVSGTGVRNAVSSSRA